MTHPERAALIHHFIRGRFSLIALPSSILAYFVYAIAFAAGPAGRTITAWFAGDATIDLFFLMGNNRWRAYGRWYQPDVRLIRRRCMRLLLHEQA